MYAYLNVKYRGRHKYANKILEQEQKSVFLKSFLQRFTTKILLILNYSIQLLQVHYDI